MGTSITPYQPNSFSELEVFVQRITKSGMVPRQYQGKPDDAFVAIAYGAEVGLPPLAALQHVAVINGRPGLYGDAIAGVALKSGAIKSLNEWLDGAPNTDGWTAHCEVVRPDGSTVTRTFSMADAKRAGLAGKQGPWAQFPQRMLAARARGYAVRDAAPHSFLGYTVEELRDIDSVEQHRGPDKARDITPRPAPQAAPAEEETVKQLVHIADEHGEVLHTTSIWQEALRRYGEAKKASTNPVAVAVANLAALRTILPHTSNGTAKRLAAEIEAAEAVGDDSGMLDEPQDDAA